MLVSFHSERLDHFISSPSWVGMKYVAFETLPDVFEAEILLDVLRERKEALEGKKVWISFSCSGDNAVQKVVRAVMGLTQSQMEDPVLWLEINRVV